MLGSYVTPMSGSLSVLPVWDLSWTAEDLLLSWNKVGRLSRMVPELMSPSNLLSYLSLDTIFGICLVL